MSLNKFTDFQTGIDIKLEIGAHILECDDLIVLNSITLPPNVFVDNLTVNDSLTIEEIGKSLGKSRQRTWVILQEALALLKKRLENDGINNINI